jgi:LysM repeat protein
MNKVVAALAAVALILGIVGIVSGTSAKKANEALLARLTAAEQKADEAVGQANRSSSEVRALGDQVQRAFAAVSQRFDMIQEQVTKIATPPKPAPRDAGKPAGGGEVAAPGGGGKTHTIASGDTFGKLAKKYGTTTAAIEKANPGVDSARLKIGQKIQLP